MLNPIGTPCFFCLLRLTGQAGESTSSEILFRGHHRGYPAESLSEAAGDREKPDFRRHRKGFPGQQREELVRTNLCAPTQEAENSVRLYCRGTDEETGFVESMEKTMKYLQSVSEKFSE